MNKSPFYTRIEQLQPKIHGMAVGMTLGIGSMFLSQGCPLVGQCTACAGCVPRLPLLALPLLADGVLLLSTKVMSRAAQLRGGEFLLRQRADIVCQPGADQVQEDVEQEGQRLVDL